MGFVDAIKKMSDQITDATIDLYKKIQKEKLPIPSKFHYTFNLRDVSKVFQGILMVKPTVVRDEVTLTRLWIHEISRVFHDRLINDEDRLWFNDSIVELVGRYFRFNWSREDLFEKGFVLFGDLLRLDSGSKDYEEIKDMKKLLKVLEDKLDVSDFINNLITD